MSSQRILYFILLLAISVFAGQQYKSNYRPRSGIAHGGIGSGSVELRQNGQFYNWSIFNNYPRGTGPIFKLSTLPRSDTESSLLFFLVRYQTEGEKTKIKLLKLDDGQAEGALSGIAYYYPWMTTVEQIDYNARFPFTTLKFSDSEMPFEIQLVVHSPFIPHDAKNSSLPGVFFDFKIVHTGSKPVNIFLIATLRNLVGYDKKEKYFTSQMVTRNTYKYFDLSAGGMDKDHPTYGSMGLASLKRESTHYLGWEHKHPYYELLLVNNHFPNIDDTAGRNKIDPESGKKRGMYQPSSYDQRHFSSIGVTKDLKAGESLTHTFLLTWYFPNAYGSYNAPTPQERAEWNCTQEYWVNQKITKQIGNYYNNFFNSSADVADYMIRNSVELKAETKRFFDDFFSSDLQRFLLEQIASQLNTFRTSATFDASGQFGIREGMSSHKSWGPNITSDVTFYGSSSIISLFPSLQLASMRAHRDVQTESGDIAHGLAYDLDYTQNGTWGVSHRVDLAGNYIQMVVRDYLWSGNRDFISEMWPSLKAAFEFSIKRWDLNGDQMPDMNGIMSSYDNFPMYGLASYIHSQWLNTARSMFEVAKRLEDAEMQAKAGRIYRKAKELMETHLWNGQYYVLAKDVSGNRGVDDGCLTDQIIGQWMAHQSGFGHILNPRRVKSALKTILNMSYRPDFGLRNCTWPDFPDLFPIHKSDLWVDQANTCWSGVELAFASFLMYEDMYEKAIKLVKTVDERYRQCNLYFDHQEFGGHYLRPMSAWGILNGVLGLAIQERHFSFSPCVDKAEYKLFFSFNNGTAFFTRQDDAIELCIQSGVMQIQTLSLDAQLVRDAPVVCVDGKKQNISLASHQGQKTIRLSAPLTITAGSTLSIR